MGLKLRTEIEPGAFPEKIAHQDGIVTIGSCFSDSIGNRLLTHKWEVLVNPFGTLFHPMAIGKLLRAVAGEPFSIEESLIFDQGMWHSLDMHSAFSGEDRAQVVELVTAAIEQTRASLARAKWLFLTWGSAKGYYWRESGALVANCHRVPAVRFESRMATVEEILSDFRATRALLHSLNPNLRVMLTVSPVRHTRDTLVVNGMSKATLRVAAGQASAGMSRVFYFPAYEMMVDDLRDYRFVGSDLVHPNELALEYIWGRFGESFFSISTHALLKRWEQIHRDLAHKPFRRGGEGYRRHLEGVRDRLQGLAPQMDVRRELREVEDLLASLEKE